MFLFGSAILHANIPLKKSHLNLYSLQESCVLPFHSGYTSARVVRINWQLADKVACFSPVFFKAFLGVKMTP